MKKAIEVEKRSVMRTGIASLGWHLGFGYVQRKTSVKSDVHCVLMHGKVIAECRSKQAAELVAASLRAMPE